MLEASAAGELARYVFEGWRGAWNNDLALSVAAELHNDGTVDFLDLDLLKEADHLRGSAFFMGQHFYCKLIPQLAADLSRLMTFVDRLVQLGGNDMASNQPNAAFLEWCKEDPKRSEEVISLARANNALGLRFLTFALTAANAREDALEFLVSASQEIRLSAMTALGRMEHDSQSSAENTIKALEVVAIAHSDDAHHANAIVAIFGVYAKQKQVSTAVLEHVLQTVCADPGPQVVHQCSHALWEHAASLDEKSLETLVQTILAVKSENKGTISGLNLAFQALFKTTHIEMACDAVFRLLTRDQDAIDADDLKDVGRDLVVARPDQFLQLLVHCFLSGNGNACEWIQESLGDTPLPDGLDEVLGQRNLNSAQLYFLCRKAIGYFFFRPVEACRVLLAALKIADAKVAEPCARLLFDPLAINYSGSVLDFLKSIPAGTPSYPFAQKAIGRWEEYMKGIEAARGLKELMPSEHQRYIERKRHEDVMRAAHKEAEKHSMFFSTSCIILLS